MSKKDILQSVIGGIVGTDTEQETQVNNIPVSAEVAAAIQNRTEEQKKQKKVGRPRKYDNEQRSSSGQNLPPTEIRATFIVEVDVPSKLKYIAYQEGKTLKTLMGEILNGYFEDWEKENGKIKLPKKK